MKALEDRGIYPFLPCCKLRSQSQTGYISGAELFAKCTEQTTNEWEENFRINQASNPLLELLDGAGTGLNLPCGCSCAVTLPRCPGACGSQSGGMTSPGPCAQSSALPGCGLPAPIAEWLGCCCAECPDLAKLLLLPLLPQGFGGAGESPRRSGF